MRRLSYTRPARADLDIIQAYLTRNAGGNVAADQIERIRTTAKRLRDFPKLGARDGEASYRTLLVQRTPYLFVYRVLVEQVQILRVFHGARDWRGSL